MKVVWTLFKFISASHWFHQTQRRTPPEQRSRHSLQDLLGVDEESVHHRVRSQRLSGMFPTVRIGSAQRTPLSSLSFLQIDRQEPHQDARSPFEVPSRAWGTGTRRGCCLTVEEDVTATTKEPLRESCIVMKSSGLKIKESWCRFDVTCNSFAWEIKKTKFAVIWRFRLSTPW